MSVQSKVVVYTKKHRLSFYLQPPTSELGILTSHIMEQKAHNCYVASRHCENAQVTVLSEV